MAYITETDVQKVRQTSYISTSWTSGQYTDAITLAEAWATDELSLTGGISTTAVDWERQKHAMCIMTLSELCAGAPQGQALRNQAIYIMRGIKKRRQRTDNKLRDDGDSYFGRANGTADTGSGRGAIF